MTLHSFDDLPTGHLYRYWGELETLEGWLVADGRYINKETPGAKKLYYLIWKHMDKMRVSFGMKKAKGGGVDIDYDAGRPIKLPDFQEVGVQNHKVLIKL
jgi:hypothetical protein